MLFEATRLVRAFPCSVEAIARLLRGRGGIVVGIRAEPLGLDADDFLLDTACKAILGGGGLTGAEGLFSSLT